MTGRGRGSANMSDYGGDSCRMYEVEPGDTFYSIAAAFRCPLQAMEDANPGFDVDRLQVRPALINSSRLHRDITLRVSSLRRHDSAETAPGWVRLISRRSLVMSVPRLSSRRQPRGAGGDGDAPVRCPRGRRMFPFRFGTAPCARVTKVLVRNPCKFMNSEIDRALADNCLRRRMAEG